MTKPIATESEVLEALGAILRDKNPVQVWQRALDLLVETSGHDRAIPLGDFGGPWAILLREVWRPDSLYVAIEVLETFYRLQCEEQQKLGCRYHKGFALHNIGAAHLILGQRVAARRYVSLAHIEDVLSDGREAKEMAHGVLAGILGVPLHELDELSEHVAGFREPSVDPHPEQVLLRFQEQGRQSRESEARLFRPNLVFARELFDRASTAETPTEKGLALEHLVAYLLTSVEGLELAEFRQSARDHETDLLIRNVVQGDPLFEVFGPYLGVECKNWEGPVGVREVNHFIASLRFAYLNAGILVARNGISGGAEEDRNARLAVLKAFHRDNVIVCTITGRDLEGVIDRRTTMPGLLLAEYETIRFDKLPR